MSNCDWMISNQALVSWKHLKTKPYKTGKCKTWQLSSYAYLKKKKKKKKWILLLQIGMPNLGKIWDVTYIDQPSMHSYNAVTLKEQSA